MTAGAVRTASSGSCETTPQPSLTLIATDTAINYQHISTTLNMPIGSIGPIRARSLARLQHHSELRDFATAG